VAGWVAKGRVTGGGDLLSTDWDVYCLDCDDSLGLDGTKSFVLALIRDAPALAELGESLKKLPDLDIDRQIPLSWFALHGKHRLIAKDEYGHLDDECGVRFKRATMRTGATEGEMPKRVKQYTMRLNDREYERIKKLAERDGVSMSDAVRMLVKREDDRLKAEKETKK
jgi:hypothetical protein